MAEACFTSLFFFYKTFSGSLLTSQFYCYMICDTERSSEGSAMYIEIDFNSDEALYVQLCNQIILGIATSRFREGEQLPSVRQLADTIGINMHTVNKAYSILQQEGFVKIDRRRGAIIAVDINKLQALQEAEDDLAVVVARAICKDISRQDIHELVDKIYDYYEKGHHS